MLKRLVNECRFNLTLETKGPFIIKDGRYEKHENGPEGLPDSIPIFHGYMTDRIKEDLQTATDIVVKNCYIPGTSLRGVIRSHAEKLVRTVTEGKLICCDPFSDESCSKRMDNTPVKIPYAEACVICKIFGCTGTASRIQIHDSITITPGKAVPRDGIGIDRFIGGVSSGANFRTLVLEGYTFENKITIRNFELWQLGLLAYVLRDLEQELITIGFGKSKGFGRVKGTVNDVKLTYYRGNQDKLKGTYELCLNERDKYKLIPVETDTVPLSSSEWESYRTTYSIPDSSEITKNLFWKACAKAWNKSTDKFPTIPKLIAGDNENG